MVVGLSDTWTLLLLAPCLAFLYRLATIRLVVLKGRRARHILGLHASYTQASYQLIIVVNN